MTLNSEPCDQMATMAQHTNIQLYLIDSIMSVRLCFRQHGVLQENAMQLCFATHTCVVFAMRSNTNVFQTILVFLQQMHVFLLQTAQVYV